MLHETTRRHFEHAGFTEAQAEALADMIAELSNTFATKHDLELVAKSLENKIDKTTGELRNEMSTLKGDLTWRFIALTVFLGTLLTLVNIFAV